MVMFSSFDIARSADVVFSEVLSTNQFKTLHIPNLEIIDQQEHYLFYKNRKFKLSQFDTIFTHTASLENLFHLLKKVDKDLNLTLITHQADTPITEKLFKAKPKCIDNWYAVNVDYIDKSLIPIPIGLANEYSPKNIQKQQIKSVPQLDSFGIKENLMYVNFNSNTNIKERSWIKDYFSSQVWAEVETKALSIEEYIEKILNSSFTLCPWGNGYDTHRIWESLSLGSIPIVKNHIAFKNLKNLPILFVEDYKIINEDMLINYLEAIKKDSSINLDILTNTYWSDFIIANKNAPGVSIEIKEPDYIFYYFLIKRKFFSKLKSYNKKINYYLRKLT